MLTQWHSCIRRKGLKNILFSKVARIKLLCNYSFNLNLDLKNLIKALTVNSYPAHVLAKLAVFEDYNRGELQFNYWGLGIVESFLLRNSSIILVYQDSLLDHYHVIVHLSIWYLFQCLLYIYKTVYGPDWLVFSFMMFLYVSCEMYDIF